jgi:hypothetical protein
MMMATTLDTTQTLTNQKIPAAPLLFHGELTKKKYLIVG